MSGSLDGVTKKFEVSSEEDILQITSKDFIINLPFNQLKNLLNREHVDDTEFNRFYAKLIDTCYPLSCPDCGRHMVSDKPIQPTLWTCPDCKATRKSDDMDYKYLAWAWEIFKFCRSREVGFIGNNITRRSLNIGNPKFLKRHVFSQISEVDTPFNFFVSLTNVKHTDGGKALKISSGEERRNYSFDYVLDIDNKDWKKAKLEQDKVVEFLDSLHIEYSVCWTGSKGFHTWILYDELIRRFNVKEQDFYTKQEVGDYLKDIASRFREQDIKFDEAVKGMDTQLIRCPYTVHPKNNSICLPLTREQYSEFKPEIASIDNVYKLELRNRGLVVF